MNNTNPKLKFHATMNQVFAIWFTPFIEMAEVDLLNEGGPRNLVAAAKHRLISASTRKVGHIEVLKTVSDSTIVFRGFREIQNY